jgi:Spy/CpxP family protein refolding chaperone
VVAPARRTVSASMSCLHSSVARRHFAAFCFSPRTQRATSAARRSLSPPKAPAASSEGRDSSAAAAATCSASLRGTSSARQSRVMADLRRSVHRGTSNAQSNSLLAAAMRGAGGPFFDGHVGKRRVTSMAGQSAGTVKTKEQLLEDARKEREARQQAKRRDTAALRIQSVWRGRRDRRAVRAALRKLHAETDRCVLVTSLEQTRRHVHQRRVYHARTEPLVSGADAHRPGGWWVDSASQGGGSGGVTSCVAPPARLRGLRVTVGRARCSTCCASVQRAGRRYVRGPQDASSFLQWALLIRVCPLPCAP